jgi:membrane protease subunit HflK
MFSDRRIKTSLFAIAADLVLTGIKAVLAWITGSAALLADALHSGTDFFVSVVLLSSLIIRHRQEVAANFNAQHASQARNVESLLAIFVSLAILYVPVEILLGLGSRSSESLSHLWVGIVGTLVVMAIIHVMSRLKTHVGQETDSPALEADGYHSKVDFFSSLAVLLTLVGALVGIYLDEVATILIALLIAIAGIELLISGIGSFVKGDEFHPVSFLEAGLRSTAQSPLFIRLKRLSQRLRHNGVWLLTTISAMAACLYLLTGFTQVPLGYVGVKQVLGANVTEGLEPGLHYAPPAPIGSLLLLPHGRVYAATVGSQLTLPSTTSNGLWQDAKAARAQDDDTQYLGTGDQNVVHLQLEVQYRLSKPEQALTLSADVHSIVHGFAQSALWQQVAQRSMDEALFEARGKLREAVAQQVTEESRRIGLELAILDIQVQSVQPPAVVVPVYRDRLNAAQEKAQRVNRAEAQRAQDLLLASAETTRHQANAVAQALERELSAEGESQRFAALGGVFTEHPESAQFHQYVQTLTRSLRDKSLVVVDPAVDKRDPAVWGASALIQDAERK